METRLTSLESRFDAISPTLATHTDISTLELKIAKVESTLVKWFAGVGIAIITVLLSAMSFFFSSMHSVPAQVAQPIIIHIPAPASVQTPVTAAHKN